MICEYSYSRFTVSIKSNTRSHANPLRSFTWIAPTLFLNTFLSLCLKDVWKHNFTAHRVLFQRRIRVTSFVMALADLIFQNDIKTALCAPVLIIRSPVCLYCFTHTMKCAHCDCMWRLCVCVCERFIIASGCRQFCVKICYIIVLRVAGVGIKFSASVCVCV